MKKYILRFVFALTLLLFLLLLLVGAALAWLQTDSGQKYLEKTLNRVLVWEDGRVEVSGFSGRVPFDFQLDGLSVHDRDGAWLEMDTLRLHWSLKHLLNWEIYIYELGAQELGFKRLPEYDPHEEMDPPEIDELPLPAVNLESFYLKRILVDKNVFGEQAEFALDGGMLFNQDRVSLVNLDLKRLDKTETHMALNLSLEHEPGILDVDASFLDTATLPAWFPDKNLPPRTSLILEGSGKLSDWSGKMSLRGEEKFEADLDLNLQTPQQQLHLVTRGDINISPDMMPQKELRHYLQHPLTLKSSVSFDPGPEVVKWENLELGSPEISIESQGELALGNMQIQSSTSLEVKDINPLLDSADITSYDPVAVQADFQGKLISPEVQAGIYLGRLHGHGFSLQGAALEADLRGFNPEKDLLASAQGEITAHGLHYTEHPSIPEELSLAFDLDYSRANTLSANQLLLTGKNFSAEATGEMDLESLEFTSRVHSQISSVQDFLPHKAKKEIGGNLDIEAKTQGNIPEKQYHLQTKLKASDWHIREDSLNTLMGPDPALQANLSLTPELDLVLRNLELQTREAELMAQGTIYLDKRNLDMHARTRLPSLSSLGASLDRDLTGSVSASASAQGRWDELHLSAQTEISDFQPEPELPKMQIQAEMDSVYQPEIFYGGINLDLMSEQGSLDIGSDFSLQDNSLSLPNIQVTGMGSHFSGDMDMDLDTGLAKGKMKLSVPELQSFSEFIPVETYGELIGSLYFEPVGNKQDLDLHLEGTELVVESLSITQLDLQGRLRDAFSEKDLEADLNLLGVSIEQFYASTWRTTVQGQDLDYTLATEISGQAGHPLEVSALANYSHDQKQHHFLLEAMEGSYAQKEFTMVKPLELSHSEDQTQLSPFELRLGAGTLKARGHVTPEEAMLRASLSDLPLADIPVAALEGLQGELGADLKLNGPPDAVTAEASISATNVGSPREDFEDLPSLDFLTHARLRDNNLDIQLSLLGDQEQLAQMELYLPVHLSLSPASIHLPSPTPLNGSLIAALELGTITPFLLPADQLLTGRAKADLNIEGTTQNPVFSGTMELADGNYEHIPAGVYLQDIHSLIQAREDRIELRKLEATDGEAGLVQGQGHLDLDLEESLPWHFELTAKNAKLLRHPLATIILSSGDLAISGNTQKASVQGRLVFERIEAELPKESPPEVVHLPVTEKNKPDRELPPPPRQVDLGAYPVDLDLDLIFPARVFVRGRGLDSEWGGNLRVTGTAQEPRVRGELNLIRGRLTFLDRRFDLDRGSTIYLDGSHPPEPTLDITAHYKHRDKDITVRILGRTDQPAIHLSSDPPMHEDEILAWVLFGRDPSTLTPFQAITLINAARTLAMGQTGPDFMGQVRTMIGVDDIEIVQDPDEGHTQFGLGKYVHEQVYIQFRKGIEGGTDQASVEVELTPRFMLEGTAQSDAEGRVRMLWKYDY